MKASVSELTELVRELLTRLLHDTMPTVALLMH